MQASTGDPHPETRNPKHRTLNPQTLNPEKHTAMQASAGANAFTTRSPRDVAGLPPLKLTVKKVLGKQPRAK